MRKTIIIGIIFLVLFTTIANAFGMGVINNMDFGRIVKGETYYRPLSITVFDSRYVPYTTTPIPFYMLEYDVEITSTDENIMSDGGITQLNQFNVPIPVYLTLPNNIKKGDYNGYVCACATNGMFRICACADLHYEVVSRGQLKK